MSQPILLVKVKAIVTINAITSRLIMRSDRDIDDSKATYGTDAGALPEELQLSQTLEAIFSPQN